MENDLNYYLNLPYKIEIVQIPPDEGGGFSARLPLFGQSIVGGGETREEALRDLDAIKEIMFKQYLRSGAEIPEPPLDEDEGAERYSGKFMVRMPRLLHARLAKAAKINGTSLNNYVTALLAANWAADDLRSEIESIRYRIERLAQHDFQNYFINYQNFKTDEHVISDESKYPKAV